MSDSTPLLRVRDLAVQFNTEDGAVKAVNGVSFDVFAGQVFAIVGESGSGKSVTAMSILRLLPTPPAEITSGSIIWQGEDLLKVREDRLRQVRGGEIAMIFQDPLSALNPVLTVGRQVGEMAEIHLGMNRKGARAHAIEMLDLVGIPQPATRVDMHPHEFSGGMRQRVMVAMAIACKPKLLIADEPTTALDVTVQAQVLEVLVGIKDEIGSSIILITHDLGVVAGLADKVMVMYAGREAESGSVDQIFYRSAHPYTKGLIQSIPVLAESDDESAARLTPIGGQPPSMLHLPSGCAFHPRCRYADRQGVCVTDVPALRIVDGATHTSSCHFAEAVLADSIGAESTVSDSSEWSA